MLNTLRAPQGPFYPSIRPKIVERSVNTRDFTGRIEKTNRPVDGWKRPVGLARG